MDDLDLFSEHLYVLGLQDADSAMKNLLLTFYKAGITDMLDVVYDKMSEIGADEETFNALESLSE